MHRTRPELPDLTLGGIGAVVLLYSTVHFLTETNEIGAMLFPLLTGFVMALPAIGIVAVAYRLSRSEFPTRVKWHVVGWALVGMTLFAVAFWSSVEIRRVEGRIVGEPLFALVLAAGAGLLGGAVAGLQNASARASAGRAERDERVLGFLNHVIRHDVRNEMNIIRGYLGEDVSESETRATVLNRTDEVLDQLDRTEAIVDAVTDDTAVGTVDVTATLESEATAARESFPHAEIAAEVDPGLVARGNEALRTVVTNLVTNAVEHGGDPPEITIRGFGDGNRVVLEVVDRGPGMTEAEKRAALGPEGGGFGLYLARVLVESFDGRLDLLDNDPRGTRAVATLRAADPNEAE